MFPELQLATACFSHIPPNLDIKITPLLWKLLNYLTFQIIISTHINQKIKILLSLLPSQALNPYNPNVFILLLSL